MTFDCDTLNVFRILEFNSILCQTSMYVEERDQWETCSTGFKTEIVSLFVHSFTLINNSLLSMVCT